MAVVSVLDIKPGKSEVIIGEFAVEIRGLSMHMISCIVEKFPAILAFVQTGKVDDPLALLTSLPAASVAIMAAGVDKPDDPMVFAVLSNWEMEQQVDLLTAVMGRTLQGSAGPFVKMLLATAARGVNAAQVPQTSESTSTSPPNSQPSSDGSAAPPTPPSGS